MPNAPERKIADDLQRRNGRAPIGMLVPQHALEPVQQRATNDVALLLELARLRGHADDRAEHRNIDADVFNQGGALVGGRLVGGVQPVLRPVRWSSIVGVREVGGLQRQGNVALPVHTGAGGAGWVDGNGTQQVPKGDEKLGQVALLPRHVGARTTIRRGLLKQASIDVEAWVRDALRESVDDATDEAILQGTGVDNEPLGIVNMPGVNAIRLTTAGSPTRDEIIDAFAAAAKGNANPQMVRFVGDSTLAQTMRKARVEGGAAQNRHSGSFVLEDGQLAKTAPFVETNHAPSDTLICGDFTRVVIGRWTDEYDIVVNPYGSHGPKGEVEVTVFATVDVGVAQPKAFAVAT